MTTYKDVLAWDPATVKAAATTLDTAGDSVYAHLKGLASAKEKLRAGWQGVAADSALAAIGTQEEHGKGLGQAVDAAQKAVATGGAAIDGARNQLVIVRDRATAARFTIGDDGSVTPPPVQPRMASPEQAAQVQAEIDREAAALQKDAQTYADDIARYVGQAAQADATMAAALNGLTLPGGLWDAVKRAYSEAHTRLSQGQGVDDILKGAGTLGSAIVAGQALWKVKGVVTQGIGLGTYLTNAVKGAMGYSKAMQWLATGKGNPAEFLAMSKYAQGMEDGASLLTRGAKAADPGMFGKLPGFLGTAGKVAGYVGLPLTIYGGIKDVITGGGYDGTRGGATRVMGAVGAAGATALLVNALPVAASLGPVGLAVAGAAVTAYGAWQLGNFVYDHREQIGDAVGKAKDVVVEKGKQAWNAVKGWFK